MFGVSTRPAITCVSWLSHHQQVTRPATSSVQCSGCRWQEQAFRISCSRLGVCRLDALLLHAPGDLVETPGGQHLESWMLDLRDRGAVRRLGVSIYTDQDLNGVNPALLDLVQLPLSLFDQRLLQNGTISRLRANGTAIHARSLYLQGLLLTPAAQWP